MSKTARAATGAFALLAAYSVLETQLLKVRRFDVAIENLPPEVEGLRVVQLSDFHRSAMTSQRIVRRAVELCNAQNPDVVLLTGDFVSRREVYQRAVSAEIWDEKTRRYAQEVTQELGNLRAPDGVFAIPGNHDSSVGEGFSVVRELLEARGIGVLRNSSTRLRGVLPLIGLDDLLVGRPNIPQACAGISANEAQIVMAHNPRMLYAFRGRNALVLAGHTHGGQITLLFFPHRRWLDRRGDDFKVGWYENGDARMYVTSGVGSVHLPFRFFSPPEIVVFTLTSEFHDHECGHDCDHEHHHEHHHEGH